MGSANLAVELCVSATRPVSFHDLLVGASASMFTSMSVMMMTCKHVVCHSLPEDSRSSLTEAPVARSKAPSSSL